MNLKYKYVLLPSFSVQLLPLQIMVDPAWQEVLAAVFCLPGECHLLDRQTARREI